MAILQLTDEELAEVRLHLGAKLTVDDLSDDQIKSSSILQSATDYVFERVREDLDLDLLTETERGVAERLRDQTAEDIVTFINTVLTPPQQGQMRRAVIFRTAGLCAPVVSRYESVEFVDVSQRRAVSKAEDVQASLFERCDEEIDRLRNAFPDDAFLSNKQRVKSGLSKINLFVGV